MNALGFLLLAALLGLTACGSSESTPVASQPTAVPPTMRPLPQPVATPTVEARVGSPLPPTALPVLTPAWPPPVPPSPTPPVLATLVHEAEVIARVNVSDENGASQSFIFSADVTEWLKRPPNLIADQLGIWIPTTPPALMPEVFRDQNVRDWVVFLTPRRYNPNWGPLNYDLADLAGAFAVRDGKIVAASLPEYMGQPLAQLEAEISRQEPTPVPIAPSVHDLSTLGQKASLIAEVQWPKAAPLEVTLSTGKRYLLNVPVTNWLRNVRPPNPEFLGLSLAQDEYDLLSHGSGRYILFLDQGESGYSCIDYLTPGHNDLINGARGVFEIVSDRIGAAGVPAYKGVSVQDFKKTLLAAVPTPGPAPTGNTRPTLPYEVHGAEYIVEADLTTEGTPGAYGSELATFQLRKSLRIMRGFAAVPQMFALTPVDLGSCRYLLGKGPYILFMQDPKLGPNETPQPAFYYPFDIFAIHDGAIAFGSLNLYSGWPVERFEAAIRALP